MNIYDFIYFLHKQYDTFKDNPNAYNRWQDALFDYMDITKTISGESYILMKPDDLTPKNWINEYITNIFYEYFPDTDRIYLDD
jgi:hypothetical protein